jgi:hypothetical protein
MRFSLLLLPASASAFGFNAVNSLFSRQTQVCYVLPIKPTTINGMVPCGGGSLDAGCMCCPDGKTTCEKTLQTCQISSFGGYVCKDKVLVTPPNTGGGSRTTAFTVATSPTIASPRTTTTPTVKISPSSSSLTTARGTTSTGSGTHTTTTASGNSGLQLAFSSMLRGAATILFAGLNLLWSESVQVTGWPAGFQNLETTIW